MGCWEYGELGIPCLFELQWALILLQRGKQRVQNV